MLTGESVGSRIQVARRPGGGSVNPTKMNSESPSGSAPVNSSAAKPPKDTRTKGRDSPGSNPKERSVSSRESERRRTR
ncbi:MAG: hypothetical protein CO113_12960 [Elusimicrobia bacterium CG_4_9_14_3_um_filter_62_55]|nr:MAG: hypothetical protein COX66_12925 [Elusimicrobia bacterium CG_4_10_14_0_2_um_filter_63_34]PJB24608.1 MAG: hypothetical protein CO113_12960 [Elusimicrobia bacterium CG_4_9_14_3_um_filter_62_55]